MSRQVRHRVAAVVLGGLLLAAPLLTNGTASAEQTAGKAHPNPDCAFARKSAPMLLTGPARATVTPSPDDLVPFVPSDPDEPSMLSDLSAGLDEPTRAKPTPSKSKDHHIRGTGSSAPTPAGTPPGDHKDQAHGVPTLDFPPPPGTAHGVPSSGSSSSPGKAHGVPSRGSSPSPDKAHGVPTLDFPPPPDRVAAAPAGPPRKIAAGIVAAEPTTAMRPRSGNGPIGLLAMVAMVCVLGVAVCTIRAIVAQRAYRTNIA